MYAERMMLENGYGNQSDEMWLIKDKNKMRVTLNAILDRAIQVEKLSETDAVALLRREGFQGEAEARNKLRRCTLLTQVQLSSYFAGYSAIMALREEVKQQQGPAYALKAFHEQFTQLRQRAGEIHPRVDAGPWRPPALSTRWPISSVKRFQRVTRSVDSNERPLSGRTTNG